MNVPKTEQKQILLKDYCQIGQIEKAIRAIQENNVTEVALSVLGTFEEEHSNNSKGLVNKNKYLRTYFKELLGVDTDFDSFYNPETGRVIVAGFLASMFVHEVGKKKLGSLSGGPYGILRGLGVSEFKAATYVKKLNDGKYLLLVRGDCFDIENVEDTLEKLAKIS